MTRRPHNAGFSLFELVAAMMTASVLALTAGTMLQIGYTGWVRNGTAVEVQRDGTVVMDMISRAIRQASATNISVAVDGITVGTPDGTVAFFADGNDLKYDSDVGGIPSEQILVDNRLASIAFAQIDVRGVAVELQLEENNESTRTRGFFAFRN